MPVVLLSQLPIPSSLELRHPTEGRVWLTASRGRAAEARAAGEPVFGPAEYEGALAAILGARAGADRFTGWVRTKRARPAWVISPAEALDGAVGLLDGSAPRLADQRVRPELLDGVTWARALELIGCELVGVHVEQPSASAEAAAVNLGAM